MMLLRLDETHEVGVIEMGMNQRREIFELTAMTEPDVALWLNVGTAHIGELGSIEAIAEAKAEILEAAPPHAVLVVNRDDRRVMEHARAHAKERLRTFGRSPDSDVRLVDRRTDGGRAGDSELPSSMGSRS
ncbi:MAG: UDP-N-acetylmuramoyl-tripeptide--D-alanyl-D-alanine ligase, partial [Myxococcales bacterium]|nr:UDP-N-acetylmuramoyl-tripeptide--D-alanyl-D-alanine ligase [Myxococcales bacterium]